MAKRAKSKTAAVWAWYHAESGEWMEIYPTKSGRDVQRAYLIPASALPMLAERIVTAFCDAVHRPGDADATMLRILRDELRGKAANGRKR